MKSGGRFGRLERETLWGVTGVGLGFLAGFYILFVGEWSGRGPWILAEFLYIFAPEWSGRVGIDM
jgi:hypothetical protein